MSYTHHTYQKVCREFKLSAWLHHFAVRSGYWPESCAAVVTDIMRGLPILWESYQYPEGVTDIMRYVTDIMNGLQISWGGYRYHEGVTDIMRKLPISWESYRYHEKITDIIMGLPISWGGYRYHEKVTNIIRVLPISWGGCRYHEGVTDIISEVEYLKYMHPSCPNRKKNVRRKNFDTHA